MNEYFKCLLVLVLLLANGCSTKSELIKSEAQFASVDFENNGILIGQFEGSYYFYESPDYALKDYTLVIERILEPNKQNQLAKVSPFTDQFGFVFFALPEGRYRSKYLRQYKSTNSFDLQTRLNFELEFEINAGKLTNIGKLHLVKMYDEVAKSEFFYTGIINNTNDVKGYLEYKKGTFPFEMEAINLEPSSTLNGAEKKYNSLSQFKKLFENLEKEYLELMFHH